MRGGWRRCGGSAQGDFGGQTNRPPLYLSGHWLRRKLFSQRRAGVIGVGKKIGYPTNLVEAVEMINETQKKSAKKLLKEPRNVEGLKIAVWGLSFKPHTDDMRSAPSIAIIEKLLAKGAKISAYDPVAIEEAKKIFNNRIEYSENMYDCLKGAEALLLITEWPQFKEPDFVKMKELLKRSAGGWSQYLLSRKDAQNRITYVSVGRPDVQILNWSFYCLILEKLVLECFVMKGYNFSNITEHDKNGLFRFLPKLQGCYSPRRHLTGKRWET